jgi:twitching motility protein PilT
MGALHFLLHSVAGRVRATFYRRNGHPEMSFRFCGDKVASREELGLPEKIDDLARKPNGLVLITGPTGAGKTTTLNYLVDLINNERRCKIVTIEDPIEFVHENKRAIVVQQEVLTDVRSFNRALIHVLRQDPDVIVVGEMRDPEAIATALTAAETGHLVLATMHSPSVSHAIERIVGVFEGSAQRQIIMQLSNALQGIISQDLLPAADRTRRVLAYELVVANGAVRNLIRENQLHQLENMIQTGRKDGMVLMDNCLYDLYCKCAITYDTAISRAGTIQSKKPPASSTIAFLCGSTSASKNASLEPCQPTSLNNSAPLCAAYGSCLVAYSGGVDSVFLARVAHESSATARWR